MRFDVDEPRVDLGDALSFARGLRFGHQRLALNIGREHEVDQAFRAGRGFLLDAADARAFGDDHRAAFGRKLAADQAEERGLAGAVAPHEPDMRAGRQRGRGVVDQEALAEPIGEGADMQHGRAFRAARPRWQDRNGQPLGAAPRASLVEKFRLAGAWCIETVKRQVQSRTLFDVGRRAVLVGRQILNRVLASVGLSIVLSMGAPSASYADDGASSAATASDTKAAAKEAEPVTTKDPQIALDDLELLLAPMTKEETETEAKGWYALLRAKEREITVAELDVRRKNREIAQLEKQKTAAADLAKATEEVKAATSDKDKEAAAQHLAEAQKNLAQTVKTASKETAKEEKKAEATTAAMAKQAEAAPPPAATVDSGTAAAGREGRAGGERQGGPAESGRIRGEEIRGHWRHRKG